LYFSQGLHKKASAKLARLIKLKTPIIYVLFVLTQIKDLSFQQELNLDKTDIQGEFLDVSSVSIQIPIRISTQVVTATTAGANNQY
jgi:hypothetical protein